MMNEVFAQARAHHAAGRFADAVQACQQILQREPENIEAVHLCGVSCYDNGQAPEAVIHLEKATIARPDSPAWRFDFGLALQAAGRPAEAAAAYQQSLALRPDNPDGWCRLAVVLRKLQAWDEAAAAYRHALSLEPTSEEAAFGLAGIFLHQQRWDEATAKFRQTLALRPRYPEAYNGLGLALKGALNPKEAMPAFQQALVQRPRYLEALINLGSTLQVLDRWTEAVAVFQEALAIAPNNPEVIGCLGNAWWDSRDFTSALAAHEHAIRLRPEHAPSYNNLGYALLGLRRYREATAAFERSLSLDPANIYTLCNLGNAQLAQNRLDRAFEFYRQALEARPGFELAIFNQSLVHLLRGDLPAGLPGYELRWLLKRQKLAIEVPKGLWQRETPLEGKTLFVCCEQGLGDTLQFVRYLPLLQARGAKIVLRAQPALKKLLAAMPGVIVVTTEDETLPPFDLYCLLLSLPLAFRTELGTIPAEIPYLASPVDKTALWRKKLGDPNGPKIGLVCSGGAAHRNDYNRSIPLAAFKPLAASPGGRLFLVQNEVRADDVETLAGTPEIISLAAEIDDFTDTAAIVANLDLVISADTSVAHLAGAMGKPVWVVLPFAPDWRWMLDRSDSPWYPTMRLFRQPAAGDWPAVLAQVAAELRTFRRNFQGV
jgi:hypothetical protein